MFNRPIKLISVFLIHALLVCSLSPALQARTVSGILQSDEVWDSEIFIEGDVVIPKGKTLTITKDATLIYEQSDIKNYGKDPNEPELIVHGKLDVEDGVRKFDKIPVDPHTKVLHIEPYEVNTKILRDEFKSFKTQYAILWTILTASVVVALVATRNN